MVCLMRIVFYLKEKTMTQRINIFLITFLVVTLFVFGFYYLDTHNLLNSLQLGGIGGIVVGTMAALLVPFVLKKR